MDESIFGLIPYLIKGWFLRGSRPTKKYIQEPYKKICVFGALGVGEVVTKMSPKINGKKYLAFLKKLQKNHKRICIIIDNARWHLTKEVMTFIEQNDVKLIRLPPYSPELNPIEQYWKNVKNWIATKPWISLPELIKQLQSAFRKDFLLPDISDY